MNIAARIILTQLAVLFGALLGGITALLGTVLLALGLANLVHPDAGHLIWLCFATVPLGTIGGALLAGYAAFVLAGKLGTALERRNRKLLWVIRVAYTGIGGYFAGGFVGGLMWDAAPGGITENPAGALFTAFF